MKILELIIGSVIVFGAAPIGVAAWIAQDGIHVRRNRTTTYTCRGCGEQALVRAPHKHDAYPCEHCEKMTPNDDLTPVLIGYDHYALCPECAPRYRIAPIAG